MIGGFSALFAIKIIKEFVRSTLVFNATSFHVITASTPWWLVQPKFGKVRLGSGQSSGLGVCIITQRGQPPRRGVLILPNLTTTMV